MKRWICWFSAFYWFKKFHFKPGRNTDLENMEQLLCFYAYIWKLRDIYAIEKLVKVIQIHSLTLLWLGNQLYVSIDFQLGVNHEIYLTISYFYLSPYQMWGRSFFLYSLNMSVLILQLWKLIRSNTQVSVRRVVFCGLQVLYHVKKVWKVDTVLVRTWHVSEIIWLFLFI